MKEERPIVFEVGKAGRYYILASTDKRSVCAYSNIPASKVFDTMVAITEEHNNLGYAVLFEVD